MARAARSVRIDRLVVVSFVAGEQIEAEIEVECSSGTYIRTLAADLGAALGGVAHLKSLRRERVGSFTLADAHPLEAIVGDPVACSVTMLDALASLRRVEIDDELARLVANGRKLSVEQLLCQTAADEPGPFAVAHAGALVAVYERHKHELKPSVVLAG